MTTATVLPSSMGSGSAEAGQRAPEERGDRAQQEPDEGADDDRRPRAPRVDLGGGGLGHDPATLDVPGLGQELVDGQDVVLHPGELLLEDGQERRQAYPLGRAQVAAALDDLRDLVDLALEPGYSLLLGLEPLLVEGDLGVGVTRGAVDDDLAEQVGALPARPPLAAATVNPDGRDAARAPPLAERARRDAAAQLGRTHADLA